MVKQSLRNLLRDVQQCSLCANDLEHGVRPVLQVHSKAKILIAGQAPGRRVHKSGVPFDDPSGDRLREWMGISPSEFYDARKVAILPMGFCYPGTGRSGDLPPRPECAEAWRDSLLQQMTNIRLTLVIGQYAIGWHLNRPRSKITEIVKNWKKYRPQSIPMPHPSPRNNLWLKKNPWFEVEVLPYLRRRVTQLLRD